MQSLGILVFILICIFGIALGALKCFVPAKLRELQKRYRPKADWSDSAGGKLLEDYAERQARNPTFMHRSTGLLMMAFFLYLLAQAIGRLLH